MRVFMDFEASSLGKDSFPVEVAWVFEDGRAESYLIRPASDWTDWDDEAEAIHGISRAQLEAQGTPHDAVCSRLIAAVADDIIYASSPSWDGHWLSMLLRASGHPRHLLRLSDSEEAFAEAARVRLGEDAHEMELVQLIAEAHNTVADQPVAHRALEDARREHAIWQAILTLPP